PLIINFCCSYNLDLALSTEKLPKNVKQVKMLSLGKLSPKLILEVFEKGADGVLVTPCDEASPHGDGCHFGDRLHMETGAISATCVISGLRKEWKLQEIFYPQSV
ncbi:MAG: hydrogenase iron-sulfur subunit, partial [Candidatus Scalindua sp.]